MTCEDCEYKEMIIAELSAQRDIYKKQLEKYAEALKLFAGIE